MPVDLFADITATTENGRKVILKNDGTWRYAPVDRPEVSAKAPQADAPAPQKMSEDISAIVDELKSAGASVIRNAVWGMSSAQVKQSENLTLLAEGKEQLKYDYVLVGMKCNLVYAFKEDKLTAVWFTLQQKHHDPALFNRDFAVLVNHLSRVYGAPAVVSDLWKDDLFKSDESKWGFAVSIGFLTRMVTWRRKETRIGLKMEGGNHEILISIRYSNQ